MAQTKPASVPVLAGMREDLSTHLAPLGTLAYAKNVRFPVQGEAHARCGTRALSAATDCEVSYAEIDEQPSFLARAPGGFLVGCEGFGFRYDDEHDRLHVAGSYANAEPLGVFDVMAREEVDKGGANGPWPLSQATINGYVCTVYSCGNSQGGVGPGDSRAIVHVMTEAGALVMSTYIDNVSVAWVVADGSTSTNFILLTQTTTTLVSGRVITTSATGATMGAPTLLATLSTSACYWAAATWPTHGWLLLSQQGGATLRLDSYAALVVTHTVAAIAVVGIVPCSVYGDEFNAYVGWSEGAGPSNAKVRTYDTNLSFNAAATLVTLPGANQFGPPLFGPSRIPVSAMWAVTQSPSDELTDTSYVTVGYVMASGGVTVPEHQIHQCTAASAPFGNGYLWVRAGGVNNNTSTTFQRVLLLDFMDKRVVDIVNYGDWRGVVALTSQLFVSASQGGNGSGWYRHHLANPIELSDGSWVAGIPRMVRDETPGSLGFALAEWLRFKVGGARATAPLGDEIAVAGFPTISHTYLGTRHYNGSGTLLSPQCTGLDLGFPLPPAINVAVSNGAGALTVASAYQWRVVVERIDHLGRRWRSAPSAIAAVDTGAADDTGTITARLETTWLRADAQYFHSSRFVAHVYRTTAGGETFYRATPPQGAPTENGNGVFTYTDTIADTDLDDREILYTDGGVLNNDAPPSCRFIAATEDRVWLAGLWETEQLQSSKTLVPGEPPQFSDSPAFRAVMPEPCTGIATQDGTLIAFAKGAIYVLQGGGPSDQGQGAWDTPRCITRSTGCISHLSILVTSIGVFFQSKRGMELLPRGFGEPVFIGAGIQTSFDPTATVIEGAAVVTSDESRTARFCTDIGIFTFDLDSQAWAYDEYSGKQVMAVCDTDEGAVIAPNEVSVGGYGFLREETNLQVDSTGDVPTEIASTLTWAAAHPFTIAGWGRFNDAVAMFDSIGAGFRAVNCSLFVDVDVPTVPDPGFTFAMNTLGSPSYRKHVQKQVDGTAVRLRLTTSGAGWRCMGWTLDIDDHGGSRRVAGTEQG